MGIHHWVVINNKGLSRNNAIPEKNNTGTAEELYIHMRSNYPKFYKMDKLCKWAFIATEYLFAQNDALYQQIDKSKIAVVLSTSHGCLEVDKRYAEAAIPSPALFVYTLPNIMMGELCIRHGFKGEQVCMVSDKYDAEELYFTANTLLTLKGMDACLCGWVDASGDNKDICLFWVTKGGGISFWPDVLQEVYRAASAS